jgi:hypothetical protein
MIPFCNPWSDFTQATMRYHENLVDGLVRQPANAWTNISYILAGAVLFVLIRRSGEKKLLYCISVIAILTGITSFLYHASNMFLFQFLDLSCMFLFSCLLIALNARRMGVIPAERIPQVMGGLCLISAALLLLIRGKIGIVIFSAELAAVIVMEIIISLRGKEHADYSSYLAAIGVLIISCIFWTLDYTGHSFFSPDNHWMQGHGLWHIINSFCFYFIYRFYRQFNLLP